MKRIIVFATSMVLCATAALLLHPLLYIVGIEFYTGLPHIVIHYFLTYIIVGTLLWYLFRRKVWWKQVLIIFVGVNIVLFSFMITILSKMTTNDGMTGLLILWASFGNALLSVIPICISCYFFRPNR